MREVSTVWVVETGEYEDRFIVGIYDSRKSAIEGIKEPYGSPYVVRWEQNERILTGHFEEVANYCTKHSADFEIDLYPVEQGEKE